MEVIPLDGSLVKGSHGRLTDVASAGPVVITSEKGMFEAPVHATAIRDLILRHMFGQP